MEGYRANTYGDRFADVYDDWYGDISDVAATVGRVVALATERGGGPVLELGGGSGRLAVPLAQAGLDVWTIDASEAMVERLGAKPGGEQVHAVLGDMARLDHGSLGAAPDFAVVLCAFNTLFNLVTTEDQLACLRGVAAHLAPGGCFVVEAFVPPPVVEPGAPVTSVETRHIGLDEVVLTVSRLDPATRTIRGQHVQLSESGGVRLRPWLLHYAAPDELDDMAAAAGLRLVARHAGWRDEPFGEAAATHVSRYERR